MIKKFQQRTKMRNKMQIF